MFINNYINIFVFESKMRFLRIKSYLKPNIFNCLIQNFISNSQF